MDTLQSVTLVPIHNNIWTSTIFCFYNHQISVGLCTKIATTKRFLYYFCPTRPILQREQLSQFSQTSFFLTQVLRTFTIHVIQQIQIHWYDLQNYSPYCSHLQFPYCILLLAPNMGSAANKLNMLHWIIFLNLHNDLMMYIYFYY